MGPQTGAAAGPELPGSRNNPALQVRDATIARLDAATCAHFGVSPPYKFAALVRLPPLTLPGSDPAQSGGADAAQSATADAYLFDDEATQAHRPPGYHAERPERLLAARRGIAASTTIWQPCSAGAATEEQLLRVHDAAYLAELGRWAEHSRGDAIRDPRFLDADTYFGPASCHAARVAAGGAAQMVRAIWNRPATEMGEIRRGFALVRPPGHHARPGQAMGFCLLNNVGVAAAELRALGAARVAIVDFDVHHGNGTQEMFDHDPHVLYISTHQSPCYPGTGMVGEVGTADGRGFTLNVPLDPGATEATYRAAFERLVIPVLEEYAPEFVLVSAGFDAALRDPLSDMRVRPEAFGFMTAALRKVADKTAAGRIALVLEGGYDLTDLEAAVGFAANALARYPQPAPALLAPAESSDVRAAIEFAKEHWAVLRG